MYNFSFCSHIFVHLSLKLHNKGLFIAVQLGSSVGGATQKKVLNKIFGEFSGSSPDLTCTRIPSVQDFDTGLYNIYSVHHPIEQLILTSILICFLAVINIL